ncbi:MAG: chaperonin GroEL, partial [Methanobacterium sp.]|nr:chaperonin GroEL [Methanobacterium sp.]
AAEMILRIDDVSASTGAGKEPDIGGMEGMGGMPGGMPPMM